MAIKMSDLVAIQRQNGKLTTDDIDNLTKEKPKTIVDTRPITPVINPVIKTEPEQQPMQQTIPVIPQQVQTQPQNQQFNYEALQQLFNNNQPKQYQEYKSPYEAEVLDLLRKVQNQPQFNFDTNNPALIQAQQQAMQQSRMESEKRGRLYDTYAASKEQQAAQQLIPDFYRLARSDYDTDKQNQYNILNTLRNIDQTGYERYNNTYNNQSANQKDTLNNLLNIFNYGREKEVVDRTYTDQRSDKAQDDREKMELQNYGVVLNDQQRALDRTYQLLTPERKKELAQYGSDYQSRLNQLDPNSQEYKDIQAMRFNKVASDVNYRSSAAGSDYGFNTIGDKEASANFSDKQIARDRIQTEILREKEDNELKTYGVVLNDTLRGYKEIEKSMNAEEKNRLTLAYGNNFAGRINELTLNNPNDPEINKLMALRNEKILNSPELLDKYGSELGVSKKQTSKSLAETTIFNNEAFQSQLKTDMLKAENEKSKIDLQILEAEIKKVDLLLKQGEKDLALKELDILMGQERVNNYSEEVRLGLEQKRQAIENDKKQRQVMDSSIAENYARIENIKADTAKTRSSIGGKSESQIKREEESQSDLLIADYNSKFNASGLTYDAWLKTKDGAEALGGTVVTGKDKNGKPIKETIPGALTATEASKLINLIKQSKGLKDTGKSDGIFLAKAIKSYSSFDGTLDQFIKNGYIEGMSAADRKEFLAQAPKIKPVKSSTDKLVEDAMKKGK